MKKAVATLLLITISISPAYAQMAPASIHSRENLGLLIDEYVRDFNAWKKAASEKEKEETQSQLDEKIRAYGEVDDFQKRRSLLVTDLRRLQNSPTAAERLLYKIFRTQEQLNLRSAGTHNEAVAHLMADYFYNWKNRDALFPLIEQLSNEMYGELQESEHDKFLKMVSFGTMTAWSILTIWEWRTGKQNRLSTSIASGVGRGARALVSSAKASVGRSIRGKPDGKRASAGLIRLTREMGLARPGTFSDRATRTGKKAVAGFKKYAVDLAASFLTGGSIASLVYLNDRTQERRIDPKDLLDVFQSMAIVELENSVLNLRSDFDLAMGQLGTGRISEEKLGDLKNELGEQLGAKEMALGNLEHRHKVLVEQAEHFLRTAPQYSQGRLPYPVVLEELEAEARRLRIERGMTARELSREKKVRRFVERQKRSRSLVRKFQANMQFVIEEAGFRSLAEMNVSLVPIQMLLGELSLNIETAKANIQDLKDFEEVDLDFLAQLDF